MHVALTNRNDTAQVDQLCVLGIVVVNFLVTGEQLGNAEVVAGGQCQLLRLAGCGAGGGNAELFAVEAEGNGQRASAKREHYPEPTGVPSLPVWTDELGRELRTRTGLDHPPTSREEALVVMLFGLAHRAPELHKQLDTAISSGDDAALAAALKRVYRHRAQELHPDSGGTKVAFQVLGAALGIL